MNPGALAASGIGLAQGMLVGAAVMVINAGLGILPRLSALAGRRVSINAWAAVFAAGVLWGCIITLFDVRIPLPLVGRILAFLFYGGFVGVLILALAETLDFFPACLRGSLPKQLVLLALLAVAAGKVAGSLYFFAESKFW